MRNFKHIDARSVEETCELLGKYGEKAVINAGGTDLLSVLKGKILNAYPEIVINIKAIPNLDYIREDGDYLRIGALAKLSDMVKSPVLMERYRVLAEAAQSVASPQVRNMATLGGNLCQDVRCWYYRYPQSIGGPISCLRKGKGPCLAVKGDNRYHAIFGGKKCFAVCPSDTAVALTALDAQITIAGPNGERTIAVTDFYNHLGNVLKTNEMINEIKFPKITGPSLQVFDKFTLRKPIDFAIVSVASVITVEEGGCIDARIALGAVASNPIRAKAAEEVIIGQPINEDAAAEAAKRAVADAKPLSRNAYKVEITKTLVKRAILG
jgi:xanthine dehydrogenase YagS FAD-binding subunit